LPKIPFLVINTGVYILENMPLGEKHMKREKRKIGKCERKRKKEER
jgi:hypothetical protein